VPHQGTGIHRPQRVRFVRLHPFETVAVGDVIDDAAEPGKRVGERAVEVEDHELVTHR
jgi:hypothetical protein